MAEREDEKQPLTTKECFGRCGNLKLKWSSHAAMHYIATSDEKMDECDRCDVFAQCSWRVQMRLFKELVKWIDDDRREDQVIL